MFDEHHALLLTIAVAIAVASGVAVAVTVAGGVAAMDQYGIPWSLW